MADVQPTRILTHPGSAHKDEFLACATLLAQYPLPIDRREPSEADLADPAVYVLDVGHQHEPTRANFDHHQFPREATPTCSLSLILQHLGLYEDARRFCDWLETSEWLDCRGPVGTADFLGVERDVLFKLNSPVDVTLLRRFAASNRHEPGEPLWEVMKMIGEDLIEYVTGMKGAVATLDQHLQVWELPVGKVAFVPRTDPLPEEPTSGLHHCLEGRGLDTETVAMVYPDKRGNGFGLKRYNDHPALDFTRIESEADVHFAHKGGFIAKTSASEVERLKELVVLAGK